MKKMYLLGAALLLISTPVLAEEVSLKLDPISVTATRLQRKTAEVPASIAVIDSTVLADTKMFNIKEALTGVPGVLIDSANQGYDSRLIIRGAGLKAPYGVRDIMVLRDGIPVTDPDSFTRLDMIDTQLIERIEVVKGPNSTLWGVNAAGGVINIISKNPLERQGVEGNIGFGEFDTANIHLSYADSVQDTLYYSGSVSHRRSDNSWRRWNEFKTTQVSLQPVMVLSDGSTLENSISYSTADLQLPGSLNETQFAAYRNSGEASETDGAWQYSGRYSNSYFMSSKLTKELGPFELIPLVYFNVWDHHHPVTGRINDADTMTMGTDIQLNRSHSLANGIKGTLTLGATARYDEQDTDYFKYAEFTTVPGPSGRIAAVLSDRVGSLQEVQGQKTTLWGLYVQESISPMKRMTMDLGIRYDSIDFDISGTQWGEYSWSLGKYVDYAAPVSYQVDKSYQSLAPRIAASYGLTDTLTAFASAATGVQTPTSGEINDNPNLELVESQSYETGLKVRTDRLTIDTSIYYSPVENEVVTVRQASGQNEYVNAGKTNKKGFEFAGTVGLVEGLEVGATYAYSRYTFDSFTETVRVGAITSNIDRSGNQLPFVPRDQYSLFLSYHHPSGFKARLQADSWGSYFMDNANSEKYAGYQFVTNFMVGYETDRYDFTINADNLFDKRYAVEVTKDTSNKKTFKPAAPQTFIARVKVKF